MKKQKQEGNKYDKILKENIKMILMPFIKKRLGNDEKISCISGRDYFVLSFPLKEEVLLIL